MNKRIITIAAALMLGMFLTVYASPTFAWLGVKPETSKPSVLGQVPASAPRTTYRLYLPFVANGCGPSATVIPTTTLSSGVPNFSHVYVLIMENKEYGTIIGNPAAPYLNCLASGFGLATNYTAVTHPSEPNYFALFSGSTQSVTDDGVYDLPGQNVADQLEAGGKTWKIFAQNYPLSCSTAATATGGEDDPVGNYARKHNPAISFTDISGNSSRCANITDLTHFDPAAANYEMIVPNLCNDTHDCAVSVGDAFLSGFLPKILNSSAWFQGGVLFIVYDEGTTNTGGGGVVVTEVISNYAPRGKTSSVAHNHYSLLRTIEDAWSLGCLNSTCAANNFSEFFQ
jgi:hypothetical protein